MHWPEATCRAYAAPLRTWFARHSVLARKSTVNPEQLLEHLRVVKELVQQPAQHLARNRKRLRESTTKSRYLPPLVSLETSQRNKRLSIRCYKQDAEALIEAAF